MHPRTTAAQKCGQGRQKSWRGDLIGLRSLEITPELVGQRIAQFVALEIKTNCGVVSPEQRAFLQAVQDLGGLAAVCRSVQQAQAVLTLSAVEEQTA